MDRIQAIDCMLGDLKWDSTNKLNAQANPIDIPVNIYSYQGKDSWLPLYDNVSPGKGVSISNLSSVDLDNGDIPTKIQGMKIQFQDNYGQLFWDSMIFNSGQL
jgi:hypothetical protein